MPSRLGIALGPLLVCAAWLIPVAWTSASAGCPEGTKTAEHVVADGETLSEIAVAEDVTVKSIMQANPKVEAKFIRVGQTLKICKAKPTKKTSTNTGRSCGGGRTIASHEVGKGETLSRIAKRYGVSEDAIVRRNAALKNDRNNLRVGQQLLICAGQQRAKASKSCGYRTPVHRHEVVPGENASGIAGRYGISRRELYRLNPKLKANPNSIRTGQTILVCPNIAPRERVKIRHAVQSGENLGTIAKRYGLTPRELERYQQGNLKNPNSLKVGQKLIVWKEGSIVSGFGGVDDDKGVLNSGMQLPPGQHYVVKHPTLSYGTSKTIRLIQTAVSRYRGKVSGGPKVHIGDISKRGGGKFPPHVSHQHGRDVDVGYVLKGEHANEARFRNANANNLDMRRTWALVKAFLDTNEVQYIFMDRKIQKLLYEYAKSKGVSEDTLDVYFQYPRNRSHGMIRHSKGHVNHFHVRFYK